MSKKNKNLVIFDNDRVLIDSEKLAARTNAELLTKLGYPMTPAECETRFTGMSDKAMVALLQADGYALPADFIEQMYASSKDAFETELEPVYGVKAVVQRVFASGFKAAVASNAPRSNLIKNLQTTGYSDILHPEMCFSGHEVAQPKPAPDLHQHILYRYDRLAAQAIVVEDSPAGAMGAQAAGVEFIGVLYAVAPHLKKQRMQEFQDLGAIAVLDSPEELGETLSSIMA